MVKHTWNSCRWFSRCMADRASNFCDASFDESDNYQGCELARDESCPFTAGSQRCLAYRCARCFYWAPRGELAHELE